jgi:hypothetical protein
MPAKDEALEQAIQAVHRQHPVYGHRRVALELDINHKRKQRVMAKSIYVRLADVRIPIAHAHHQTMPITTSSKSLPHHVTPPGVV